MPEGRTSSQAGQTLYFTFDDGPSALTPKIASYLSSQGVTATFFALGNNIPRHEQTVASLVAMGHRVGNHTLTHDLAKLKSSFTSEQNEVARTAAMVERLGGDGRMVRIPYGATQKSLLTKVASEGARIFEWDINSNDSSKRGVRDYRVIEQSVLKGLEQSGKQNIIILFHDGAGHDSTLTALQRLVPRLKERGYRFGVLSRTEHLAQAHDATHQ